MEEDRVEVKRRAYRRDITRRKEKRLKELAEGYFFPHGFLKNRKHEDYDHTTEGSYFVENGRCHLVRTLKKKSRRRLRRCKDVPPKGNHYRKITEYWYEIY